jgi:hypothetical protein
MPRGKDINRGLPSAATRDLVAEPGNPETLYVAMAQFGGVGTRLDGGDYWRQTGLDDACGNPVGDGSTIH